MNARASGVPVHATLVDRLRPLFPPLQWVPGYRHGWLRRDAVAGMTLAAYAIPVSLAYASLAGLPPVHGVYCYLAGGLAYTLFGSSRQLAIGPTSAISLLVGTSVGAMANGDAGRALQIAALVALIFAVMSFVAWALRLSSLVNFISETILLGFKAGAAITIATTQLPKLFGVPGGGDRFFGRIAALAGQLPYANPWVLAFGVASIALLLAGERWLPRRPVALLVVAGSIAIVAASPLPALGMKVVGELPGGVPSLALPSLRLQDAEGVVPLALACLLLAYIEGVSAARALAHRNGYEVDPRQELFALGTANLAAAVAQGYPVAGGLSQSTVNDNAGAKSPLALAFASGAIALCLVFLTGMLRNLPEVVLAAVVLVAIRSLVDVRELAHVWSLSRTEFAIAMVALGGVLLLGILQGVLLAAIVSVLMLIGQAAAPHVAPLGRVPGTERWSDVGRHPENETLDGVLILRVESGLYYFNVTHVREQVRRLTSERGPALRRVVWDLSTSPSVDIAGARLIGDLQRELAAQNVVLRVVNAHGSVRDLIRREVGESVGEVSRRISIAEAAA